MSTRPALGDFSSIVCFKALIVGVEDTLGTEGAAAAFVQAGRLRGQNLASQLGLAGKAMAHADLGTALNQALGSDGTRLCRVDAIRTEGDDLVVETSETVCSAGEPSGSTRKCTFTLGAIWGAIETIQGKRFTVKQTSSVLNGGNHDTFTFSPL